MVATPQDGFQSRSNNAHFRDWRWREYRRSTDHCNSPSVLTTGYSSRNAVPPVSGLLAFLKQNASLITFLSLSIWQATSLLISQAHNHKLRKEEVVLFFAKIQHYPTTHLRLHKQSHHSHLSRTEPLEVPCEYGH